MLVHAARTITDLSPLLPVLMPELLKRMGHLPVVEPAEEIRLGLAQLVAAVVERSDPKLLAPYTVDLCTFLCRYAWREIKLCVCACAAREHAHPAWKQNEKMECLLAQCLDCLVWAWERRVLICCVCFWHHVQGS